MRPLITSDAQLTRIRLSGRDVSAVARGPSTGGNSLQYELASLASQMAGPRIS